ncbi:7-carboxy-7-deazaguanine synthase [uncultured archaeon]|nr:7-carboxy-7-deazaguanine synthase [uncultured archaeon]
MPHEAALYEKNEGNAVRCRLCAHRCLVQEGKRGVCGVRGNEGGKLYALSYGKIISSAIDPVEKKPLFHFLPGTRIYSIAGVGCNFRCKFCQNWEISQHLRLGGDITGEETTPEEVVEAAAQTQCKSIAFTYTEPTIFHEFNVDVMKLAKKRGLKTAYVSNGFITPEAVTELSGLLDAVNVDIKAFTNDFYVKICGATLEGVLEGCRQYRKNGVWLEITTLVIPGQNDDDAQLTGIARFIAEELGADVPWHVTAFHPDYQMKDVPATPVEALQKAYDIGKKAGLRYVYAGNIPHTEAENTLCPKCQTLLIERDYYAIKKNALKVGACPRCSTKIAGVWK